MDAILTWKNDSIVGLAKQKYIQLRAKVSGTLISVAVYIRNPGNASTRETARRNLNKKLLELCNVLGDFSSFYVRSDLYIRKGAGFSNSITSVVPVIIEVGLKIYETIVNIVKAKREELIKQMQIDCALKPWQELQN